jgi:hypothetical protein
VKTHNQLHDAFKIMLWSGIVVLLGGFRLWAQAKPATVHPAASSRKLDVPELAPAIISQDQRIRGLIDAKTKRRIAQIAIGFSARVRRSPPTADFHGLAVMEVRNSFQGAGKLQKENIEALAFLLMVQAARDAQSDWERTVYQVNGSHQQKDRGDAASDNSGPFFGKEGAVSVALAAAVVSISNNIALIPDSIIKNLKCTC